MAGRNRRTLKMLFPPFAEGTVQADEEGLFWGRGFCERIGDVGAKNKEVLHRGNSIEQPSTCLIDAVGVGFREDEDLPRPSRAIADASSFLTSINGLDIIGPDEMENCVIFGWCYREAKHILGVVLVQLEVL